MLPELAAEAGLKAIKIEVGLGEERHHPHCLLYGVYRDQGFTERSAEHLTRAIELAPWGQGCMSERNKMTMSDHKDRQEAVEVIRRNFPVGFG
jgi:hypothetical protein